MAPPVLSAWRQRLAGRGWRTWLASHGWLGVAVLVGGGLAVTALMSPDRQQQLQEHVASGPLRDVAEAQVLRVDLQQGDRQWQALRTAGGWTLNAPGAATATAPQALSAQLDGAVRLLRNAAIERELPAEAPEYGLAAPQALQVRVFTRADAAAAPDFTFTFGGANPVALARYTRLQVAGGAASAPAAQVVLLPSYVAEAWEQAVGLR
ncbi:hypothetical protein AACH10_13960 [Ideonella sp. DXS22W]|uniref:DUF4340 domain-containing protein n=1 Tax=Pseudaquabacterium inlustre TaxID=2984192 RepID=A0ABU9CLB2_9BURK